MGKVGDEVELFVDDLLSRLSPSADVKLNEGRRTERRRVRTRSSLCLPVKVGRDPLGTPRTSATRLMNRLIHRRGCGLTKVNGPKRIMFDTYAGPGMTGGGICRRIIGGEG